jgi:hypothetical protein
MCFNRKKIIARAIHHTRRKVTYPDLASVKSVGYLFSGERIRQESCWKTAGIPVNISYITFIDGKRGDDSRTDLIYRSDLNLLKFPPDKLIHHFIETPFDLLFDMDDTRNDVLTYICASSKAMFKVGYTFAGSLFDLVIGLDETNKHKLSEEVIKTLRNLKSNS